MDKAKESPVGVVASWSALVASFALSFATWVALAEMAGFRESFDIFGTTLYLSFAMAVAVDGYVVSALVTWMAPVSDEIARFAKVNTYAGAAVGVLAQSAYHGLSVQAGPDEGWKPYLAAAVGALPPLAAGLSVHLRALVRRAALSTPVRTDMGTVPDMDTRSVLGQPDTNKAVLSATDTLVVPDMDTLPAAPVDTVDIVVPVQRRTRSTDKAWKAAALEMIRTGEPASDREIAEKILADWPETWPTVEAGRKAVSRLR